MTVSCRSLRRMVYIWLSPASWNRVRVPEFRNRPAIRECYVRVEVERSSSAPLEMFFFRHRDGGWRVFPPSRNQLTMGFSSGRAEASLLF